ncbi:MAG: triphosphoribosyl-dephospho-CoA synthase, partial [Candidatus Izemoplasmataceae bacterium]
FLIDSDQTTLKNQTTYIENTHQLGRFIDLDVYDNIHPLSRAVSEQRSCYLCDQSGHFCARNQTHPLDELNRFIEHKTFDYIKNALTELALEALRKEVYVYPKFGLVSHIDSGAHKDMDISHFLKSIEALKPYFLEFLEAGITLDKNLHRLRDIGKEAEKAMFKATGNINTHKGAIFIFGAFLPFVMDGIIHQTSLKEVVFNMQTFVQDITKDDFEDLSQKETLTPGEIIYQTYGLKGIRGEVSKGFPSVFSWYPNKAYNHYQKLCAIMAHLEDTTIIKRHNYSVLKEVKNDMRDLLKEEPFNFEYFEALSKQYKEKGISPGGSADLLALTFFIESIETYIK